MKQKEKIAAVVVTYNRKELLKECLDALLNQTYPLDSIILIDNASTDGTPEFLKEKGYLDNPKIDYVRLPENTGGAGGFHEGVKRGYKKGYDWLWLMDDDVKPDIECLKNLLFFKKNKKVLVPIRLDKDLKIQEYAALKYNINKFFSKDPREVSVSSFYHDIKTMPEVIEIQDFSFEGPLINRNIIKKIGYPNKDFFILFDDTDYSLRIKYIAKEKIFLIKNAKIYRILPISKGINMKWKEYYYFRNFFYMHHKYGKNIVIKIKPIFFVAGYIFKNIFKLNFKKFKIFFYALVDSYKNPMPKRFLPGSKI